MSIFKGLDLYVINTTLVVKLLTGKVQYDNTYCMSNENFLLSYYNLERS